MYVYSKPSKRRIETLHPNLQHIMNTAIKTSPIDFGIPKYGGKRTDDEQYELFQQGLSQLDGIKKKSKHQSGRAVDVYAYVGGKASWDEKHLYMLAGHLIGVARSLGYDLRWGGDWDGDRDFEDQTFIDLPHFELIL